MSRLELKDLHDSLAPFILFLNDKKCSIRPVSLGLGERLMWLRGDSQPATDSLSEKEAFVVLNH